MGGSLLYSELLENLVGRPHLKIQNFVETGTYHADTSLEMAKYFENVYTTEIVPKLYEFSKERAKTASVTNIYFHLGDSVKLLKTIMPQVLKGAIFFLDAHQSGGDTANNGKNVPLYEELDVILSFPELDDSVFIIDDVRLWKQGTWDWKHISNQKIVEKIQARFKVLSYFEENDRFWVFTKTK